MPLKSDWSSSIPRVFIDYNSWVPEIKIRDWTNCCIQVKMHSHLLG